MTDLQTIKSTLRIEDVAGRYATLHRAGSNYKMLCPFHDDHHPSLVIHVGKQFFKCHACGAGGDVFTLVQQFEKCSFAEAVGKLAPANLQLTMDNGQLTINSIESSQRRSQQASQLTMDNGQLTINSIESSQSELSSKTINCQLSTVNCQLEQENQVFLRMLMSYATGNAELSQVYLDFEVGMAPHLVPPKWKAFAGRLIFPIRDEKGDLVGFGGRITAEPANGEAKYINSSAASGFQKGNVLYGLYQAKEAIRESGQVFVVEGYRDVLAMHAAGYPNTVALCGTALAEGQIQLLKSLDADIVFLMDSDEAGRKAAERNLCLLWQAGDRSASIVVNLPEGDDPDSLFRRVGREAFRSWLQVTTHPAPLAEEWLVTLLLMLPEAILQVKGEYYDFPSLVDSLLDTDDVPFLHPDHELLLGWLVETYEERQNGEAITTGSILENIDDKELRSTAVALYSRHNQTIAHLAEQWGLAVIDNERDIERLTDFVFFFIHEYYESRLYAQIRALTRSINRHPTLPEVTTLLAQLDERRECLASVSLKLDRVGAMVN